LWFSILPFSTRTRAAAGVEPGVTLEAPGRMPGPRGAGILPVVFLE
jgi:hypothetical protein